MHNLQGEFIIRFRFTLVYGVFHFYGYGPKMTEEAAFAFRDSLLPGSFNFGQYQGVGQVFNAIIRPQILTHGTFDNPDESWIDGA